MQLPRHTFFSVQFRNNNRLQNWITLARRIVHSCELDVPIEDNVVSKTPHALAVIQLSEAVMAARGRGLGTMGLARGGHWRTTCCQLWDENPPGKFSMPPLWQISHIRTCELSGRLTLQGSLWPVRRSHLRRTSSAKLQPSRPWTTASGPSRCNCMHFLTDIPDVVCPRKYAWVDNNHTKLHLTWQSNGNMQYWHC